MNEYIIVLLILAVVLLIVNIICLKYTFTYNKSMQRRHYRELMREYKKIYNTLFEIRDRIINHRCYNSIDIANQFAKDMKNDCDDKSNLVDIAIFHNKEEK